MTHLMHLGLSNALVAGLIAVVATVVTWRARCPPALAYGMWLLVLLKLLTPPLVEVPLSWSSPEPEWEPIEIAVCPVQGERPTFEVAEAIVEPDIPSLEPIDWSLMAAWTWLAGSLAFAALSAWRIVRLVRWLRSLDVAPAAWQGRVDLLAGRLGLRIPPRLLTAPRGAVPPLVVGLCGRAVMVFPLDLWHRLDDAQRDAVLLHELAHLRRGDHRVRLLELAALTLYWWLPLAWWASRRLRRAEEECCDAWVVWAEPDARPAYASALVETVAFLSGHPAALPIGASGVGPVVDLKRRLSMILHGRTPRGLSRVGLALILAGLVLLPLMPTLARSEPTKSPTPKEDEDGELRARIARLTDALRKQRELADEDLHARLVRLADELKKQRDAADRTAKELEELLTKLGKAKGEPKGQATENERLQNEVKRLREMVDRLKLGVEKKQQTEKRLTGRGPQE